MSGASIRFDNVQPKVALPTGDAWSIPYGVTQFNAATYGASPSASMVANTAAILAGAAAAQAAGGGVLTVPEGAYNITVPSLHFINYRNVTIRGTGQYRTTLVDPQGRAPNSLVYPTFGGYATGENAFLTFTDPTNCVVEHLGFQGSGTYIASDLGRDAVGRKGIYSRSLTNGAHNLYVRRCYFTLIEGEVFYADGASVRPQRNVHFDRNHVYQCLSNGFNLGVGASGAYNCSGDDNVFEDCGGSPAQFGGVGVTFSRNKILMPSAFFATSDQILCCNALGCKIEDNLVIGVNCKTDGVAIVNIGFQFDANTTDVSVRRNLFRQCKVLNTGHGGIIVVSASTVGATTKGVAIEHNDLVECADADHVNYPGAKGIRFIGTQVTTGIVAGNNIDNRGVTDGLAVGVCTEAATSVAGVVMKPNTFSSDVTTPYSLNVAPTTFPQTYTVTNPSTDRALNVTADTLAQGLAVLGTLIADLQAQGLIK